MMKKAYFKILCFSLVIVLLACEKKVEPTEGPISDFDRVELLEDLSEIIYDSYENYNSVLVQMIGAVEQFTLDPSAENLSEVRINWSAALLSWQSVAPFQFGLANDLAMESSTNIYPVSVDIIEENINSGTYNLDAASNISAVGFQTIDYLIHGLGSSSEQHVEFYTSDIDATNRVQYLQDVSSKLLDMSALLLEEWKSGSVYRETFVSNSGTDQGSSLGLFLNAFVKSFETSTRTTKIGIPSGAMTFSMTPLPLHVEAYYERNNSLAYLNASIEAFENLYHGTPGNSSLKQYLDFLNAKIGNTSLDEAIVSAIVEIQGSIAILQDPLSDFVVSDQEAALEVFSNMQNLVVLWKVDMMSALGILITYQDNDGD